MLSGIRLTRTCYIKTNTRILLYSYSSLPKTVFTNTIFVLKLNIPLVHVELFTPSHTDTKSTLPLPLCHKSQMLSQAVQQAVA